MKCLVAYRLLQMVEGKNPSQQEMESLFKTIGAQVDASHIKALLEKVEGKTAEELISQGISKVSVASAAPAAAEVKKEAAKAPVEEEESSEEDMDLFG
ncbi:large subunit ribosomal protein LP2 [Nematocida sp. LUAm3]|nr:large subunit ribosomal protein LP2 [Nematocida sp. LUAm3]KAI5175285.1 large subunit ribosomal protein LP2 [Nematocida sp. LUAm2]KAI5177608.1 large subunit ribosomal protein LP2 [Nematocida sp. LUAm1]